MRLKARPSYAPHASTTRRRKVRLHCTMMTDGAGECTSIQEVWERLAAAGSGTNGSLHRAASTHSMSGISNKAIIPNVLHAELAGCAWTMLLRAAELPHEHSRSDQKVRSRSKHLHHRGSSQPPAAVAEKDLHRKAMFHSRKGRWAEALRLLERGMQRYPHNSFFPHSIGVIMSKRRKLEEAQKFLHMALDIDCNNSAALQALGRVYSKLGEGAKARTTFQEAVKMDPGNAAAYQAWALLEKHDGNMQKAQQLLEYCLELNPKHEPSLHALAKLHLDRCHFVQARKLLQQVLRINPSHAHSWTTLGELCYYQGDPAQSRRIYEQMVAYCGEDSIAYATWAHMETRMGDNGKARRLLERSIELDPWNTQAHTQLLALLCNDPHLEHMAPAQFRATLHRFPKNVHIRHLSAAFLIAQGREDVAQAVLEELAKEQSENGKVAQTQARLHIRRGEREAAAQCLRRGMCDSSRENALVCTEELAKLALSEGRPDVAQELLQYGAARAAPTSRYLREWGLIERKLGNTATARSLFQQSVESRAMDVRSWVAWAVLERSCDDFPKALEVLRQMPDKQCSMSENTDSDMDCATVLGFLQPIYESIGTVNMFARFRIVQLPRVSAVARPASHDEGLTVAPKVTTLWYLYCDTACKCLPLRKCREIFQEAHKCVPRCPQTYLLEATLEWKHGYEERARRAFVQGSRYAAGSPEAYSPLFQAWAHFEEVCGNSDEAAGLVAKCAQVQETEQRRSRTTNAAGVDALVDLLRIPIISTAPIAHV